MTMETCLSRLRIRSAQDALRCNVDQLGELRTGRLVSQAIADWENEPTAVTARVSMAALVSEGR